MKLYPLLRVVTLFTMTSCLKQSGKTTVEGIVTDEYTGRGIPNATVVLEAENPNLYWGGSGTVAEYAADEHGNFSFSFDTDADHIYRVNAKKKELYVVSTHEPSVNKGRKNKNMEVKLWPMAFVKFHLMEVDSIDGFELTLPNIACSVKSSTFQMIHLDQTFYCYEIWNKDVKLLWLTKLKGVYVTKDTIIHPQPLDTTDIDIYY